MVKLVTPDVFWSRVEVNGPDDCHNYVGPGTRTRDGHIRISVAGRKEYAHRYAFFLVHGVWPYIACHACNNPQCVRVDPVEQAVRIHVYNGTPQTNNADREAANRRTPYLPRRPRHWSSRLTQQDIDEVILAKAMGIPATGLAEVYNVSAETIRSVWRREALERSTPAAA